MSDSIPRPKKRPQTPSGARGRRGLLAPGDKVQLTDPKGKLHTITLVPGETFYTHRGSFSHDDLIGSPEGVVVTASSGLQYLVLRPLLADNVLSMPRGAAVIYPKDASHIVGFADVFPGARVIEAGVGSGGLSMFLLRAVGDNGLVHSFEMRDEFADIARGNVEEFFAGPHPAWRVTVADLNSGLAQARYDQDIDRVLLDMLAPWECIDAVTKAMAPGGVLCIYVATVTQLSRVAEELRDDGRWTEPRATETMVRGWNVDGLAVRPDHRMVGHTGFLLTTRRMADGFTAPEKRRRGKKNTKNVDASPGEVVDMAYGATGEHQDLSQDSDFGQRSHSDRKLRRLARRARGESEDAINSADSGQGEGPGESEVDSVEN